MLQISPFRIKAIATHLMVSAVLIGTVCLIALMRWFPYPLFLLDGTWIALLTLAIVDLLLGPFITAIISSNKKSYKELAFDYSIVLLIQLAALSFGLLKIVDQRVVALVHVENQFHLVAQGAVRGSHEADKLPRYKGIQYGMLLPKDFSGLSMPEIESMMYDPQQYHVLDSAAITAVMAPLEFVPDKAIQQYGTDAIYKFIAGKKQHGVAVFNSDMEIIQIFLEKREDN